MKVLSNSKDNKKIDKAAAFEAKELKNLRMRVESVFRETLKYNLEIKEWHEYDGGVWRRIDVDEVAARSRQLLHDLTCNDDFLEGIPPNKKQIAEFMNALQHDVQIKKFDTDDKYPDLINFKDCVLNCRTLETFPHDRKYNFNWQLPHNWKDRDKGCKPIIDWLEWSLYGAKDTLKLLLCFLNAIVKKRTDIQKLVQLNGTGGSGKSTFQKLAIALVGSENCKETTIEQLDNQFESANFYGKRLITISEIGDYKGSGAALKRLTGDDKLRYEVKGIQARTDFVYQGKVSIVANKEYAPKEAGSSWARRNIAIKFDRVVPESEKRNLISSLPDGNFTGEFVPYIPALIEIVLSIPDEEVKQYLEQTCKFVPSLSGERANSILNDEPIAQWLEDCCVLIPDAITYIGKAERQNISVGDAGHKISHTEFRNQDIWLHANYAKFCLDRGVSAVGFQRFSKNVLDIMIGALKIDSVTKLEKDSRGVALKGIAIRTEAHHHILTPVRNLLIGYSDDSIVISDDSMTNEILSNANVDDFDDNFATLHNSNKNNAVLDDSVTRNGINTTHIDKSENTVKIVNVVTGEDSHRQGIVNQSSPIEIASKIHNFKVGDKVKYVGNHEIYQKFFAEKILLLHLITAFGCDCEKEDGSLTPTFSLSDIELA
ncbi:hypothetical protein HCU40_00700 [Pseudanabaena biceps]|nr:hypothetical protein [Pseudanabaena biceps]